MIHLLLVIAISILLIYVVLKQIGSLFAQTKETSRSHFNLFFKLIKVRVTALGILGVIFLGLLIKFDVKAEISNVAGMLIFPRFVSFEQERKTVHDDAVNNQNAIPTQSAPNDREASEFPAEKRFDEKAFLDSFVD